MSTETKSGFGPRTTSVLANLERTKQELSRAALDGKNAEALDRIVNDIARGEGVLQVAHLQDEIEAHFGDLDSGEANEALRKSVTDLLLRPTDDTWSGRNNDARRAAHDGLVHEAQRVLRGF